jgi:hypothetical protein
MLAALIVFVGAIGITSCFGIGAHDVGTIWFYLAEALAALLFTIGVFIFLASFFAAG